MEQVAVSEQREERQRLEQPQRRVAKDEAQDNRERHQDDLFARQLEAELPEVVTQSTSQREEVNRNFNNTDQNEAEVVEGETGEQITVKANFQDDQGSNESTLVRVGTEQGVLEDRSHSDTLTQSSNDSDGQDFAEDSQQGVIINGHAEIATHDFNNNDVREPETESQSEDNNQKFDDMYASLTRARQQDNQSDIIPHHGATTINITADDSVSNMDYSHRHASSSSNLLLPEPEAKFPSSPHSQVHVHRSSGTGMPVYRPGDRVYSQAYHSESMPRSGVRKYGTAFIRKGQAAIDWGTMSNHGAEKIPKFFSTEDLSVSSPQQSHQYHTSHRVYEQRRVRQTPANVHSNTMPMVTRVHASGGPSSYDTMDYSLPPAASPTSSNELHKSNIYLAPVNEHSDDNRHTTSVDGMHIKVSKPSRRARSHSQPETSERYERHSEYHEYRGSDTGSNGPVHLYSNGGLHISVNDSDRHNVWSPVSPNSSVSSWSMTSPGVYSDESEVHPRNLNGHQQQPRQPRYDYTGKERNTVQQAAPERKRYYKKKEAPVQLQASKEPQRKKNSRKHVTAYELIEDRGHFTYEDPQRRPSVEIVDEDFEVPAYIQPSKNASKSKRGNENYQPMDESQSDSEEYEYDEAQIIRERNKVISKHS